MNEKIRRMVTNDAQLCSVRKYEFFDGPEKGARMLEASNGVFDFTVSASKALDIASLRYKGKNISFISRNGNYNAVAPFDSCFPGGMLYTCGLDAISVVEGHAVHGRLHNIPATLTKIQQGESIVIEGEMRQCTLFGQSLTLKRKIYCEYDSNKLLINDTLINDGYIDADYVMLYHFNFGYPFLDEHTTIEAPLLATKAVNAYAEDTVSSCFTMDAPGDDVEEKCFYHTLSEGKISVTSPSLKLKVTFDYDAEAFPHFIEWRSMVSGAYALGIEPSTSRFYDEFRYSKLKSGESKQFDFTLTFTEL